ncbi:MAG: transport system ATP-binding/permease protein [Clostridiales bacterium]|nr:transport system ATP-binding/permease protein [Clostridiales bacterium]
MSDAPDLAASLERNDCSHMNLLTAEKIDKSYTDKILLKEVTFGIQETDKIGVLGINGCGKSTLLKMIAGVEKPDAGTITKGNQVSIAYLSQTPQFAEDNSILENVVAGKQAKESHWNLEGQATAMLEKFGIVDLSQPIENLSGGQKKRVALVRTLLTPADILVLDEPTNHLDHEMASWLEEFLAQWKKAFIMVTHDRYFLDQVTNKIFELKRGNLYSYTTNYLGFLELKAQREAMELATERKNQSLYRQDLEWMMRGARARSTKQKAHIERFEALKNRDKIVEDQSVEVNTLSSRLGKKTLELCNVSKAYKENALFSDFSYLFLKEDRIGIIGSNGCGKSTLLKIMTGKEKPDQGEVVVGETVKIGYFSQENEELDNNQKVLDFIRATAEYIKTADGELSASAMCEKFLFDGTLQHSLIAKLSGGEKRRLCLLKILMEAPNVLILDEPTNDLDIETLTILEDYLKDYDGIVVTVSHDRYFLDKLATRIFSFEEGRIKRYEGNYEDYRQQRGEIEAIAKKPKEEKPKAAKVKETKRKFSYQEQKEFDTIDDTIAVLEGKIEALEVTMQQEASNYETLSALTLKKEELESKLEETMERWVYLNDLAEQMEMERCKE